MYIHRNTCICVHAYTHANKHPRTHTRMPLHRETRAHTYTRTYTNTYTHACINTVFGVKLVTQVWVEVRGLENATCFCHSTER